MKIRRYKTKAIITLGGVEFEGLSNQNFTSHPDTNVIVFSNEDDDDKTKRLHLYDFIKDVNIEEIPDGVQFHIIPIRLHDPIPEPLNFTPFPFDGISIGNDSNGNFFVRFDTYKDERDEENWDLKWASDFYFRNLKELHIKENVKIFENDKNLFSEIYVQFNLPKTGIIKTAVEHAITELKYLLHKVEIKLSGFEELFNAIEIWHKNTSNKSEKFWQKTLTKYSWILSQSFNSPLILFEREAFLGGKSISNTNGKIIDFVLQNKLTQNLALIEIKTPKTKIIGEKYRNVFSIKEEVSGAICQLLEYKEQLLKDFYSIKANSKSTFTVINPKLLLIIGSLKNMTLEEKKVFELFRLDFKSIEIITFDELFEKVFMQIELLQK